MNKQPGHYLGTEADGNWWRRYTQQGFFARGNGNYWFDESALCFHRYLTTTPLCIPYETIKGIDTGTWHAGRWNLGRPIVKVLWEAENRKLCSGFVVSNRHDGVEAFISALSAKLSF
jgi:hypothetical protein